MATWVPKSQQTVQWKIWNEKFLCRIKNIDTMSTDYISMMGMPSSGDPEEDKRTANELVLRMFTINEMVDYFKKGVTIGVVNSSDTKAIYDLITEYLSVWRNYLEESMNIGNVPVDDLVLMDSFAVAVYAHAKYQFTKHTVDSIMARSLASTLQRGRNSIMRRPKDWSNQSTEVDADGVEKKKEEQYPERESMAGTFNRFRKPAPPPPMAKGRPKFGR
jgi:hypothetical protein